MKRHICVSCKSLVEDVIVGGCLKVSLSVPALFYTPEGTGILSHLVWYPEEPSPTRLGKQEGLPAFLLSNSMSEGRKEWLWASIPIPIP